MAFAQDDSEALQSVGFALSEGRFDVVTLPLRRCP